MKLAPRHILLASLLATLPVSAVTVEELAARLESLENKVNAYEEKYGKLDSPPSASRSAQPSTPVDRRDSHPTTDDEIDSFYGGSGSGGNDFTGSSPRGRSDFGFAHDPSLDWARRTQIGGYGELHLNQDLGNGDESEIDFSRFVLFVNHSFTDNIRLFSELEVEHANTGAEGDVELEQAFIEFSFDHGLTATAGLFLVPVGLINETHEPETFFGVERNNVETDIIPTTWREAGAGLSQTLDNGFGWDLAVHSGLDVPVEGSNAFRIRSGRQSVSEAPAEDAAVTARIRYNGIPGLALSAFAQYQNDITQTTSNETNSAILVGGTAVYQNGGFGIKSLVAAWHIGGDSFEDNDADNQWGFYIEPSYTWQLSGDQKVGVFGRYNRYQFAQRNIGTDDSGADFNVNNGGGTFNQFDVGVNYWPIDNVVFKVDYNYIDSEDGEDDNLLNFGVGYSF